MNNDKYGRWQLHEREDMKCKCLAIEDDGAGMVSLPKFYNVPSTKTALANKTEGAIHKLAGIGGRQAKNRNQMNANESF